MSDKDDLIRRLCESLAFHVWETQLTVANMEPAPIEYLQELRRARALIEEAGHDFDALYPPNERPSIIPTDAANT